MLAQGTEINLQKGSHSSWRITQNLKSSNKILTESLYLLYMNKEVKNIFTAKSMISFAVPES